MFKRLCLLSLTAGILMGCESGADSILGFGQQDGLVGNFQVDLTEGSDTAAVEATIYLDSERVPIVAGDVVVATSGVDEAILRTDQIDEARYKNSLTVLSPDQGVTFSVEHRPIEARADRWYPADELLFDPGPGSLVGLTAQVDFPPPISLDSPLDGAAFDGLDPNVQVTWSPSGSDEPVRILSSYTCSDANDVAVATYVSEELVDDGEETIDIDTLTNANVLSAEDLYRDVVNFVDKVALELAEHVLLSSIEIAALGLVDFDNILPEVDEQRFSLSDPEQCDISLRVMRVADGELGVQFDGGQIKASRSDGIDISFSRIP